MGTDLNETRQQIVDEVGRQGLNHSLDKVFVFELEAESHFGDRESLERAAELAEQDARSRGPISVEEQPPPRVERVRPEGIEAARARPRLSRVLLGSSVTGNSDAEVVLGPEGSQVVGQASGEKTPHSLRVLAEATLEAASKLVEEDDFRLKGASLASVLGQEVVLVIVEVNGEFQTVGAVLVREGPISEATVRATLDGINRRLEM